MTSRTVRAVTGVVVLIGTGLVSATAARRDRLPDAARVVSGPRANGVDDSVSIPLDSLARLVATRDPFRPERRPSPVAYDPSAPVHLEPPVERVPLRPEFVLRGVIAGREPRAVIEGFPGTSQALAVSAGQRVGEFRILEIGMDTVTIVSADTTWTLTVAIPW